MTDDDDTSINYWCSCSSSSFLIEPPNSSCVTHMAANTINCFKTVLDDLHSILAKCSGTYFEDDVCYLAWVLRITRTFYMCLRMCEGVEPCESIALLIEDALSICAARIESVSLDDVDTRLIWTFESIPKEDFEELWLICFNCSLQLSRLTEDEILDLTNSVLENFHSLLDLTNSVLEDLFSRLNNCILLPLEEKFDALNNNVRFLKALLHFATLKGLRQPQDQRLLTLTQAFLLNVSLLTFISVVAGLDLNAIGKISQLLQTIYPDDPHVHEIYVHVLLATKSSLLSHTVTATSCKTILGDFIDSLNYKLLELLNLDTPPLVPFKYQMFQLHLALLSLKAIMREQQNRFDDLCETRDDLIGVTICEAGILIFSLFKKPSEQGLVKDLDSMFSIAFNKIKLIREEAVDTHPITSKLSFPQTNMPGLVDSALEKLSSFSPNNADSVVLAKDQFQILQEGLLFLRSSFGDVKVQGQEQKKLQTLWIRVAGVAYQIEFILDSLVVGNPLRGLLVLLNSLTEEIKLIKTAALEIFPTKAQAVKAQNVPKTSRSTSQLLMDNVVGFDNETKEIIEKLVRGARGRDIISIVGMPGIGKTTLAKKVYHDPTISRHFKIRSWCTVSQEYNKNDLFLEILGHFVSREKIEQKKDDLAQLLYQELKGHRYLIVLDDIWNCSAWSDLRNSFPDDGKQSRVLLTSRDSRVALQIRPENEPHALPLLKDDESWELLQKKAFGDKGCPQELCALGQRIAKKCKGLPLTIVLVGGILANMAPDGWAQVEDHLTETSVDQCKEVIELSYCELPEHLKPCFLYFGIFREDQQVLVRELLWYWIGEGFVEKSKNKCVEKVAEDYMTELIERNLVLIAKRGSTGMVKACVLHDLIREFCVAKCKEEHFWYWLRGNFDYESYTLNEPTIVHRLCAKVNRKHYRQLSMVALPYLRSLVLVDDGEGYDSLRRRNILSYICRRPFKLITVLDLRAIEFCDSFSSEIQLFIHLRYLAIRCRKEDTIPSSLDKLSNLEILILRSDAYEVLLPETLWNMKKLRHLCTESYCWWKFPEQQDLQEISSLKNLQTLSYATISTSEEVLQKFPSLRKLKCKFEVGQLGTGDGKVIALDFLSQLESLSLQVSGWPLNFRFPLHLKKLVLRGLNLPWSEISLIAELRNLEVLKLLNASFWGGTWDMKADLQFLALRYLRLQGLEDLVSWRGSEDHFPCLEKLELRHCGELKEVPSCLEDITTLEMIKVVHWSHGCSPARSSIERIHQALVTRGNENVELLFTYTVW